MRKAKESQEQEIGIWQIILKDKENIVPGSHEWTAATYQIFGYQPQKVELSMELYLSHVHPDDVPMVVSILGEAIQARSSYDIEHRIIRRDGSEAFIHVFGECEDYCGIWIKMHGTVVDITAVKKSQKYEFPLNSIFNNGPGKAIQNIQEGSENAASASAAQLNGNQAVERIYFPELSERLNQAISHLNDSQRIAHIGSWQIVLKDKNAVVPGSHQWSDEVFRMLGYEPNEVEVSMGLFLAHVHPDDVAMVEAVMQKSIETCTPYDVEHRIIRKDGTEIFVHELGESTRYYGDGWVKILGTTQDISTRKQAEKYEASLKSIFENTSLSYTLLDDKLNVVLFNQAAYDGTLAERGRTLKVGDSILNYVAPDRKETVRRLYTSVVEGKKHAYELSFNKENGSVHWYWVTLFPVLLDQKKSLGMVMSLEDITERKRSEEIIRAKAAKYRSFFENSTAGILLAEPNGNILAANPSACALFRMTQQEICEAGREGIVDANHPNLEPLLDLRKRTGTARGEINFVRKDGTSFPGETSSTSYKEANGEDRISVVFTDITARKEAEAAQEQRQSDLRRHLDQINTAREEERTAVAKEIHDELGQQLSTLKLGVRNAKSKLAQHNLADDITSELLDEIDEAIKSVRRIAYNLHPIVLDREGLAAAIKCYASEYEKLHGISCYMDIDLPDDIEDKKISLVLFRIFQETLTNVFRHANADYIEVSLKTQHGKIILIISDNGVGINPEELKRKKTFGIISMKERAFAVGGNYTIDRKKPTGTITKVVTPYTIDVSTGSHT